MKLDQFVGRLEKTLPGAFPGSHIERTDQQFGVLFTLTSIREATAEKVKSGIEAALNGLLSKDSSPTGDLQHSGLVYFVGNDNESSRLCVRSANPEEGLTALAYAGPNIVEQPRIPVRQRKQ